MSPSVRFGVMAVALAAIVVGCSPAPQPPARAQTSGSPTSSPKSTAPVSAVVDQFRDGYASGTIVLQLDDVANGTVTVTRAELVDPRFENGTAWTGTTDLSPGYPISLPAVTAAPRCEVPDDGVPSSVRLTTGGGALVVPADDPHGVLPRIHAKECFALRVARTASLRLDDTLSPGGPAGTATLELVADPPGTPGQTEELTLVSVSNTTLLDEDPAAPWPHSVQLVPGRAPTPITVRPARCDPHVVAEDKVGTLIPLTVRVGTSTGVVKVVASDALRAKIYAFVARSCGWPGAG